MYRSWARWGRDRRVWSTERSASSILRAPDRAVGGVSLSPRQVATRRERNRILNIAPSLIDDPPQRILIVRLSALGDVLHCLPALSALRALYPEAKIDWVVETLGAPLIEGHPDLDRVIVFPRKEMTRNLWRPGSDEPTSIDRGAKFLEKLRERRYDLLVELQGNLRSGVIARAAHARIRVGHHAQETKEYPWVLGGRRPKELAGKVHRVEKNLHLIRALGYEGPTPAGELPPFTTEVEHFRPEVARLETAPTIIHPFVSAFGRFKEWPEERFAKLAIALAEEGHVVWLTAAPEDFTRRDRIIERSGGAAAPSPPPARHAISPP